MERAIFDDSPERLKTAISQRVEAGDDHWQHEAMGMILRRAHIGQTRRNMLEVLLNCPTPPSPYSPNSMLRFAIERGALDCLPLLHAAGFREPAEAMVLPIARALGRGDWPLPEILCPQVIASKEGAEEFVRNFFDCMDVFNIEPLATLMRVMELDHDDQIMAEATNKRMITLAGQDLLLPKILKIPEAIQAVGHMMMLGWIDPFLILQKAGAKGGEDIQALLALAEAQMLGQTTQRASAPNRPGRL